MVHTIILLVILYALNVTDYVQTIYAIDNFGLAAEVNPFMRTLLENNCAWVLKLVIIPLFIIGASWAVKKLNCGTWVIWVVTIFYLLLIIHNFCVLGAAGLL